jgi:ABC-2 type transport system permease protein
MTVLETSELPAAPEGAPSEITGPSALGGGGRRFVDLTWLIASTDYRLTYFGSALGYLWSFLRPLLFFGVLYVVFVGLLNLGQSVPHYPDLLLMNIVLFGFFSEATGNSVASVVNRESLVRKMHFPRLAIPFATVTTAGINVCLNMIVVLCFMIASGAGPRIQWVLLPVILLALAVFASGFAMLLSALYVRFRDIAPIWGVISQALFYASGIFIVFERIHELSPTLQKLYYANPIATILQQARHWMIGGSPGTPAIVGWAWFMVPMGIIAVVFVIGYWKFNREAPRIAEEL